MALCLSSALCLSAAGCRSTGGPTNESRDPRFSAALGSLERAVQAGEDTSARRILAGILARRPEGQSQRLARAFGRVLRGRALAEQLGFALEGELLGAGPLGRYRLALFCRNGSSEALRITLPPPTLERLVHELFLTGNDARAVENRVVAGWEPLALEPGETLRIDLGEFTAAPGQALARRDRWRLQTRSGQLTVAGEELPLRAPPVSSCEIVKLAAHLPAEPVDPEQLLEYVTRATISLPALLERSIRIPPARWFETLERLEPIVADLSDERLAMITPALRWLSRSARLGGDAKAWRRALRAMNRKSPSRAGLDLPDNPTAVVEAPVPAR